MSYAHLSLILLLALRYRVECDINLSSNVTLPDELYKLQL
jgi:hypothetical protein